MIGAKVIIFFSPCLLCFQSSRQNLSPGSSAFSHLLGRAQNPLTNAGGLEIGLRKRTSPFNRANVKRHLICSRFLNIGWPLSRRDMFMIYILYLLIICRPLVKRKIPSFFLIKFGEFLGSLGTINPRTYKGGGMPTPRKVFLSFFSEDKTSAPDVFGSCSLIPRTLFETSSVMVSCYGYEIWRHK